ncbi:rhodopsin, GQ-coupled-like [Dendronephthya gigantea]|uniref:rhodopsin, GQ-coupled-like n=1 Tax=Dendronephthya gigantea TaxID=151771 RepID=UPI00106B237A|nr:rhodopsin, GQ-coupled-like [Dendronephthya gigantea]
MLNNSISITMYPVLTLNSYANSTTTTGDDNRVIQSMIPVFVLIAVLALFGNLLVVFLFIQNSGWLKKAHSNLILALAITDILTAICVLCVPLFIHENDVYTVPKNGLLRELYCRIVWSHYLVFSLGVTSVYLCLSLAIERWLAIRRPHFYTQHLQSKRVIGLLVVIPWLAGFAFESSAIIRTTGVILRDGTTSCEWNPDTSEWGIRVAIAVISFSGMILIPGVFVVLAYIHILLKVKVTYKQDTVRHRGKWRRADSLDFKRVTLMAGLASIVLLICWLPGQFYFMLSQMGYVKVHVTAHRWLNVLALSSSAWNPIIYSFSNSQYRKGFKKELSRFLCLCKLWRKGSYSVRQHSGNAAVAKSGKELGHSPGLVGTSV